MVAKMKYISITGHISGMNHAVNRYLSRYDIQLELSRHKLMEPFTTLNPYAQTLRKAERFAQAVGLPPALHIPVSASEAVNLVETAAELYERHESDIRQAEERISRLKRDAEALEHFTSLNMDIFTMENFEFIYYRFGRFTPENFLRYEKFLQNDDKFFFIQANQDKDFIYGVFFAPVPYKDEADALLNSLNFDVISFSQKCGTTATPLALLHRLREEIYKTENEILSETRQIASSVCGAEKLAVACYKVKILYNAFDIKKYAAISSGRRIFTFSGWIGAEDADALEEEIESDDLLLFTRHVADGETRPPVLLKNLPVIRRFEFFTRLYGLPEYGEIDPTPILAVTYTLLFGLMFGDIGHGVSLVLIGLLAQNRFNANLGGIITVVGVSSALFGVLYGSVFGFEFNPIWMRPATDITETLIFAALLGAGLIAFSMFINMYNSFRRGKIADALFGANGISGLLFYSAAIWLFLRIFNSRPVTPLVITITLIPLVLICFKHPLENFIAGRKIMPPEGLGQFAFNTFIGLFETLLTYATNTVSFVRIGAFAVSHAGMMHVVLQLSRNMNGFIILIFGNALVILIEGILVGIQVLRLDFYELFSRFYKGTGIAFKSSRSGGLK